MLNLGVKPLFELQCKGISNHPHYCKLLWTLYTTLLYNIQHTKKPVSDFVCHGHGLMRTRKSSHKTVKILMKNKGNLEKSCTKCKTNTQNLKNKIVNIKHPDTLKVYFTRFAFKAGLSSLDQ